MKSSVISFVLLLVLGLQLVDSATPVGFRLSRYHTRGRAIQTDRQTSDLNKTKLQQLVESRVLRQQNRTSTERTAEPVQVSEPLPVNTFSRTNSREAVNGLRSRVPIRKFRPWRGNVKRRPRKPRTRNQQRQLRVQSIQKEQQNEKRRVLRRQRKRRPVVVQEREQKTTPTKNRRFARKIVEGMLQNVRGGARLIGARGNYGYVPLVNKLIDNATLIRENIIEGFDCAGRNYGYYADQFNECQVFHICVNMKQIFPEHFTEKDVYHFSFICPKYTIFSQDSMVCAWQNSAVPCEEAHNLYYMNRNFFVVSNDVQKETTTTVAPLNSGYPVAAGSLVSQSVSNSYPGGPIITSGPDATSSAISAVSLGTPSTLAVSPGSASTAADSSASGPVIQPGSVYPAPNERG